MSITFKITIIVQPRGGRKKKDIYLAEKKLSSIYPLHEEFFFIFIILNAKKNRMELFVEP